MTDYKKKYLKYKLKYLDLKKNGFELKNQPANTNTNINTMVGAGNNVSDNKIHEDEKEIFSMVVEKNLKSGIWDKKTLLLDWREGERYFAQQLTDYDVASNNGNWLWIMGGGADSQPWFRIFNPWEQGKNFDPECEYIKKWLPMLSELPPKTIHSWATEYPNYKQVKYWKPICDYAEQKQMANQIYSRAFK